MPGGTTGRNGGDDHLLGAVNRSRRRWPRAPPPAAAAVRADLARRILVPGGAPGLVRLANRGQPSWGRGRRLPAFGSETGWPHGCQTPLRCSTSASSRTRPLAAAGALEGHTASVHAGAHGRVEFTMAVCASPDYSVRVLGRHQAAVAAPITITSKSKLTWCRCCS